MRCYLGRPHPAFPRPSSNQMPSDVFIYKYTLIRSGALCVAAEEMYSEGYQKIYNSCNSVSLRCNDVAFRLSYARANRAVIVPFASRLTARLFLPSLPSLPRVGGPRRLGTNAGGRSCLQGGPARGGARVGAKGAQGGGAQPQGGLEAPLVRAALLQCCGAGRWRKFNPHAPCSGTSAHCCTLTSL